MNPPNKVLQEDGLFTETYNKIFASFSLLMSYANESNELLKSKIEKTKLDFEKQKSEEWDNANKETIEYWNNQILETYQIHPLFLNHSLITLIYSFFENVLTGLLNDIKKEKQSEISSMPRYIRDKFKEIKELSEIHPSQELEDQWQKMRKYYEVRNRIVHDFSCFKGENIREWKKDEVYKFLSKNQYVFINEEIGNFYIKDYYFTLAMIQEVQSFFNILCNELNNAFKKT